MLQLQSKEFTERSLRLVSFASTALAASIGLFLLSSPGVFERFVTSTKLVYAPVTAQIFSKAPISFDLAETSSGQKVQFGDRRYTSTVVDLLRLSRAMRAILKNFSIILIAVITMGRVFGAGPAVSQLLAFRFQSFGLNPRRRLFGPKIIGQLSGSRNRRVISFLHTIQSGRCSPSKIACCRPN